MNLKILNDLGHETNVINVVQMFTKPQAIQLGSGVRDYYNTEIFSGDIIGCVYHQDFDTDSTRYVSYMEVYFEHGSFWVDDSAQKDRSSQILLSDMTSFFYAGNTLKDKHLLSLADRIYVGPVMPYESED